MITVGVGVAPLMAGFLLVRRALSVRDSNVGSLAPLAGALWLAVNVLPLGAVAADAGLVAAMTVATKSSLWMAILVISIALGGRVSSLLGTNRVLGISFTAFALVFGASLLVAPDGRIANCPKATCLKPLVGFSVSFLDAIEREQIIVNVPPLDG